MLILSGSVAWADTFTVTPAIDGTRWRTGFPFPTFTFDSSTGNLQSWFTQSASGGLRVTINEYYLAMEFLLPTLPSGFVVTAADLSWVETGDSLRPGNVHPLYGHAGNGLLDSPDFFSGALLLATVSNGVVDGPVTIDVTQFVANRYQAADAYAGFSIRNAGYYQTQSGTFPFISTYTEVGTYQLMGRLAGEASLRPTLTITAVPEVSSCVLVSIVGMAFACSWRLIFRVV
jgi:hypothetical protein